MHSKIRLNLKGRGKNVFAANFDLVTSSMVGCYRVPHQAELEAQLQATLIGQPNQIEAVKANLEGRPARFRNSK